MGKKEDHSESIDTPRRSLLTKLWIALGLVALAEMLWLAISFFLPRRQLPAGGDADTVMTAGPASGFARGSVTAFPRGHFYLACLEDGGFLALSRTCTHLGCTIPWIEEEMRFVCPCHASTFDITGNVVQAPAPRALDMYRTFIENDMVKVDTRLRIKRSRFEKDQVVYPG
jgi:cytochrome b6-f complex iron-sulfur subunit